MKKKTSCHLSGPLHATGPNDPYAIELTRMINGVGYDAIRGTDGYALYVILPHVVVSLCHTVVVMVID
jgi:hypothetical protein